MVTLVAFVVDQLKVLLSPSVMVEGSAVKLSTVGAGAGAALTVTVTEAVAVPPSPVAVKV